MIFCLSNREWGKDIHEQIKGLYGVEVSAELVSRITDKVLPLVGEWQNRPLEKVYPFVFMDAVHYKVRDDKTVVTKSAYVVLGVNLEGYKEILGIYVGTNESSKYWLGILNELKNRRVQNVLLFCVDGLSGFPEAISAWRIAGSPILMSSITNEKLAQAGYFDFPAQYEQLRKLHLCD